MPVRVLLTELDRHLLCTLEQLDLDVVVRGGQAFTWEPVSDGHYANTIDGQLVVLSTRDGSVFYQSPSSPEAVKGTLERYFRMDGLHNLDLMVKEWTEADEKFVRFAGRLRGGVRIPVVEPFECLMAFLCSQNNRIDRIIRMVHGLKKKYGKGLYSLVTDTATVQINGFPTLHRLAQVERLEQELCADGFGYRARYIASTVKALKDGDMASLAASPYEELVHRLMELPGVGPKVADCVALFGFGRLEAVPVDTHIARVCRLHYGLDTGSMDHKKYRAVGDAWRRLFGPRAGWAHSIIFTAEAMNGTGRPGKRPKRPSKTS